MTLPFVPVKKSCSVSQTMSRHSTDRARSGTLLISPNPLFAGTAVTFGQWYWSVVDTAVTFGQWYWSVADNAVTFGQLLTML